MRVTNEVLNQWINIDDVMHRNGDVEPISENRSMKSAQDMAYDLLEARELIKEMRNTISRNSEQFGALVLLLNINQLKEQEKITTGYMNDCDVMIEKSKDYA